MNQLSNCSKNAHTYIERFGLVKISINLGACAYIEREALGRAVMWWPCFHHILELVLGAVIQKRWPTEGPRDGVYTRFKKEWPNILKKMDEILSSAGEKVTFQK